MSYRSHPYRSAQRYKSRSGPSRPQPAELPSTTALYLRLHQMNVDEGKLCTFDHGLANDWVERIVKRGLVPVGASGLDAYLGKYTSPFFCPHTRRGRHGGPFQPLVLKQGGSHKGGIADFYRAMDHECRFRVVVPRLNETQILVTWEDQQKYYAEQGIDQDSDDEKDEPITPNSSQTSNSSSSTSSSSLSSSTSSSSSISRLAVQAILEPDPRCARPQGQDRLRPTPIALGMALAEPSMPKTFYRPSVADARKKSDIDFMEYLYQIQMAGLLEAANAAVPSSHSTVTTITSGKVDAQITPTCRKSRLAMYPRLKYASGRSVTARGLPRLGKRWIAQLVVRCSSGTLDLGFLLTFGDLFQQPLFIAVLAILSALSPPTFFILTQEESVTILVKN
ncbi:hypothetical protein C8R44DRAFT_735959 [Mycena epipterygia]|nr:hypothetical protein C8R44DRAFT_735959 [Mycena epipterygia]